MRNAIGWTLAAGVSVFTLGTVALPAAHAADMGVPDYGYQQPAPGYYPPPQQTQAYPPAPPPAVAYDYPPPPPPPVAYYPYGPAPVVVGPYYGRGYGYYWHGYGPRVAYGYGRGYGYGGHYRHW